MEFLLAGAAILAWAAPAFAQAPARTPEQKAYQAEIANWFARRSELRAQAQNALNAELAREKSGDCPNADTTRAQEECLGAEIKKTQENYTALAQAIRAMLASPYPSMPDQKPNQRPVSGPTGTPPTAAERVAEFDKLEAESKTYREHAASAAYNQYKGGTLAPVFAAEAQQKLLRLHLQEMAFIYGEELSNH